MDSLSVGLNRPHGPKDDFGKNRCTVCSICAHSYIINPLLNLDAGQ